MEHRKKEKEKKKLEEFPQIIGEVNILRGKNTSTSKILFDVIPSSLPPRAPLLQGRATKLRSSPQHSKCLRPRRQQAMLPRRL
jgi:hypothetical protein